MAEDPDFTWDELEPLVRPTPVFAFAAGIGQPLFHLVGLWFYDGVGILVWAKSKIHPSRSHP